MGNAEGRLAKPGLKVVVRYTGCLEKSGKVFDSSKPKGFNFRLGALAPKRKQALVPSVFCWLG